MKKSVFKDKLDNLKNGVPQTMYLNADGKEYMRRFLPFQRLILLGGGHISKALCNFAAELDFAVTVVDDRLAFANREAFPKAERIICGHFENAIEELHICEGDYVAVLTRGHRWDRMCLEKIFQGNMPAYLGLVGSKRRVSGLFELMEEDGYSRELMERIYTPIGLPIMATTPNEIAISILAELIKVRQENAVGSSLLSLQNFDESVFEAILQNDETVMATVLETKGSVPVETGAVMIVNGLGRCAGTVGGGCGEQEVITASRGVLVKGSSRMIELDMTNEVAENNGMVCGGTMKVWLQMVN